MFGVNKSSIDVVENVFESFDSPKIVAGLMYTFITVAVLLSLLGNTFIIFVSTRYNLVKTDSVCTKILANVAVADLMMTVVTYIPKLVTAYARKWVLGPVVCFATAALNPLPGCAEIYLISYLSCYKLITLCFPLQTLGTDKRLMNKTQRVIVYQWVTMLLFIILPIILIVLCNLGLLVIATFTLKKSLPSLSATLTVLLVSSVFVLSWIPLMVLIWFEIVGDYSLPKWYNLFQNNAILFSCVLNPVIYTFTLKNFREYVVRVVKRRAFSVV